MDVAPGLRRNDTGYFISLGDAYEVRRTTPWDPFNPRICIACQRAWADAGDIFDFFAMQFRGIGYVGGIPESTASSREQGCAPNALTTPIACHRWMARSILSISASSRWAGRAAAR